MNLFTDISSQWLIELLSKFPSQRIAVVGDYFLDKYLDIEPAWAQISLETEKVAHQVAAIRHSPGAAGTVVCNLAALGAGTLHAVGLAGDDGEAYDLRGDLAHLHCTTTHLHCDRARMTPTYLKPRNRHDASLAGEHSRIDTKNRTPTAPATQQKIIASIDALLPQIDAMIILDQVEHDDCGVVTAAVRQALADRAVQHPRVIFWADSRRHIRDFRHMITKPNQFEAVGIDNPKPGDAVGIDQLAAALAQLRAQTHAPICATRGPLGMMVTDPQPTLVPGLRVDGPVDTTGAGDSATAGAVLALSAGATLPQAALIGNLVASITVQQLATTGTAHPHQLPPRLEMWCKQRA